MDTYFLYLEKQTLPLGKAIAAGDIGSIRSSDRQVEHAHLTAALQRSNSHVLEAVVSKLLRQEDGERIIEEASSHARNFRRMHIVYRIERAVEVLRGKHSASGTPKNDPRFAALVA